MRWRLLQEGRIGWLTATERSGSLDAKPQKLLDAVEGLPLLKDHCVLVVDLPIPELHVDRNSTSRICSAIVHHPLPVVASVSGSCSGTSLLLAACADMRIAAAGAELRMPEVDEAVRDGLVALLSRVVGPSTAGYWILARPPIDASRAHVAGFFHEVVDDAVLSNAINAVAAEIAQGSPLALRYAKEAVIRGRDLPMLAAMDLEADLYSLLQQSYDRAEGVAAFIERRPARFGGY